MNRNLHSPTKMTEFAREFDEEPITYFSKIVNKLTSAYNNGYNTVNIAPSQSVVSLGEQLQDTGSSGSGVSGTQMSVGTDKSSSTSDNISIDGSAIDKVRLPQNSSDCLTNKMICSWTICR